MPSPFPGMDPFLEQNPIFQELHTQMLAEAPRFCSEMRQLPDARFRPDRRGYRDQSYGSPDAGLAQFRSHYCRTFGMELLLVFDQQV